MTVANFIESFLLGLATPITAVCVLPLYPGFLAYLANQSTTFFRKKDSTNPKTYNRKYAMFGLLIALGVILFMFILGILFTTILQVSLTNVIGIISPIAFAILGIISIFLIFNYDTSKFLPKFYGVSVKNPFLNALLYGFFFGAIVIPCNPLFISAFFARALLFGNFLFSILNFLLFGIGLGFPLLLFSLISAQWSMKIIGFLGKYKKLINRTAGIIMLGISIYYLLFVFEIFG